jgi:hypothetical protein
MTANEPAIGPLSVEMFDDKARLLVREASPRLGCLV